MAAAQPEGWRAGPRDPRKAPAPEQAPEAVEPEAVEPDPEQERRAPLDLDTWPCELCGHGHRPGEPCPWSSRRGQPCGCKA